MNLVNLKYQTVKFIENIPLIQIFIYNNLSKFKFLFPHDKDYLALKILFNSNETRDFIDVGGNIGLSAIGFRELGFHKNTIHVFEPDKTLIKKIIKIKKLYKKIKTYNFGLSSINQKKKLIKAYYKNQYFHFNNSFDKKYIYRKIKNNYPNIFNKFKFKSQSLTLKKFDSLKLNINACFVKIDVEGLDHRVLQGMMKFIKKNKPVILIEYNYSNFKFIFNKLKSIYDCYRFELDKNELIKLKKTDLLNLFKGKILEKKFSKNSVNIFFIYKK